MSSTSSPCLGLLKCSIEMFNCDTTHDLSVVVAIKTESIECYDVSSARCVSVAVEGSLTSRLSRKCARALRAKVKRKCSPSPKRNSSKICLFRVPDVSLQFANQKCSYLVKACSDLNYQALNLV